MMTLSHRLRQDHSFPSQTPLALIRSQNHFGLNLVISWMEAPIKGPQRGSKIVKLFAFGALIGIRSRPRQPKISSFASRRMDPPSGVRAQAF